MLLVMPSIRPEVARLAPGFRAFNIVVEAGPIANVDVGKEALARACESFLNKDAV
jgi:hypothetical protein